MGAAETAQRLHKARKLLASREQLLVCSSPECPSIVSNDCTSWLGEVQRSLASVVVKPATAAVAHSRACASRSTGPATPVSPRNPRSRSTPAITCSGASARARRRRGARDAGRGRARSRGHVRHGVGYRVASRRDPGGHPGLPGVSPARLRLRHPRARASRGRPGSSGDWVSWRSPAPSSSACPSSTSRRPTWRPDGCQRGCSQDERNSIQTKIDIAYVSAGVAVVALGAAVVVALLRSHDASSAARAAWRTAQFPQVFPASP